MASVSSNHCSADAGMRTNNRCSGDPQKFELWRYLTSDQQTKVAVHAANLQILVHVTLANGRDQRHRPLHQVVDRPEPHNIGCRRLVERVRQVEMEW